MINKGYSQITNLSAATGLGSIPVGSAVALVQAQDQDVRWRQDGTNPTATTGTLLPANSERLFGGNLSELKFIQVSASPAAILNVEYSG
jgi:hypothetical protein